VVTTSEGFVDGVRPISILGMAIVSAAKINDGIRRKEKKNMNLKNFVLYIFLVIFQFTLDNFDKLLPL